MLKRLELVGFKSFAEKTQFDFGPGVTAIVGPNGSGKSNIVDAVRWILGEQSAKSLRGGEMADVIFNGSSTRRSLGLAEVTLTIDNARRLLAFDSDEVQITRRVYRSGEGEYLINKQPARLRDIKEMFLGSGAGTDAYCIIEQGRVDVLLQSSTRERRTIFEEAAGISRFKAKKTETLRKLEHVEQNLTRLHDIMEEIDRQLRSVKLQAAKAQRYQEHMARLRELRVALSLDEYHRHHAQLQQVQTALESLHATLAQHTEAASRTESALRALEERLADVTTRAGKEEAALAAARQRITAEEATLQHEYVQADRLEKDLASTRSTLHTMSRQLAVLAQGVEQSAAELAEVTAACQQQGSVVEEAEGQLAAIVTRLTELREQLKSGKAELMEQMRLVARLHNEQVSLRAQSESLNQHRQRLLNKTTQVSQNLDQLGGELKQLELADSQLQDQLTQCRQKLADLRRESEHQRQAAENAINQVSTLREQRSGIASRIQVLEGLEQSQEGLNAGVREVLALIDKGDPGPWRCVVGLVADLLTVRREFAPLIDLALGERAQYLLAHDLPPLLAAVDQRPQPFAGRVTFLKLSQGIAPHEPREILPEHPGIVACAAMVASGATAELSHLPEALLGSTLLVRDLAAAREIMAAAPGFTCVTLQGEVLDPNGTLTVGAHHAAGGILSRKSELRDLRLRLKDLDTQIVDAEANLAKLRANLTRLETLDQQVQQEMQVLTEQSADLRSRLQQARQRHEGLAQEVELSHLEIRQIEEELATLQTAVKTAEDQARLAREQEQKLHADLEAAEAAVPQCEQQRQQAQHALTAGKVALAKVEERRGAVAARHQRARVDVLERLAEQQRQQDHLASLLQQQTQSQQILLRASAGLACGYLDKEAAEHRCQALRGEVAALQLERQSQLELAQSARTEQQRLQLETHARDLEASDLRHRLENLAARLQEEHELDLLELFRGYQPPEQPIDGAAAQAEIAELRKKISRLGSVSLDALQELAELETRAQSMQAQHDDLTNAKRSLDDIINRINQDSRKLFTETFETVRVHFQELFRKLFGGGMAEVVLENPDDVLESGIEIIARPPGKELRSISLLSGGEKTLTAVALLLAIFRSKPSPFCILDEVDAALDEANTGRFAAVLRDFLDRSQFIMITHSKKTMATADVLYGITMQEAGVSKRVAVRLEDWPDDPATPAPRIAA